MQRSIQFPRIPLLGGLLLLASCDPTVQIIEEQSPPTNRPWGAFRPGDAALIPDSIRFSTPLDSGLAPFQTSGQGSETVVKFQPRLYAPLGADTLITQMCTMGLRTACVKYLQSPDGSELVPCTTVKDSQDSVAIDLLAAYQALRKLEPESHPGPTSPRDSTLADFRHTIARFALDGRPVARRIFLHPPRGLDTTDLVWRTLLLASKSSSTLAEICRTWSLGLSYSQARARMASAGIDSGAILGFRLENPLSMGDIHPGEPGRGLSGTIAARRGIARLATSVLDATGSPSNQFEVSGGPDLASFPTTLVLMGSLSVSAKPTAPIGAYFLRVDIEDSTGNKASYQAPFSLSNALDNDGPVVTFVHPAPSPSARAELSHADSLVTVQIRAQDRSGVRSVRIGGIDAQRLANNLWSATRSFPLGDDSLVVECSDNLGNRSHTALAAHRYRKMSINRLAPSDTMVSNAITSLPLSWRIQGGTRVRIGITDLVSSSGIFRTSVELAEGMNLVTIVGLDSAGRPDSSTVRILRRARAPLSWHWGSDSSATLPDSLAVVLQSAPTARLFWSRDPRTWTPFDGRVVLKSGGWLWLRAISDSLDERIDSVEVRPLHHVNHSPEIALGVRSATIKSYLGTAKIPNALRVTNWGLGDGVQTGSWEIRTEDSAAMGLFSNVLVDAQGTLSGDIVKDTSLVVRLRARIRDDGGQANGGSDLSAWSDWLELRIVDTVLDQDGNVYRARRMPDGKVWMRSNLRTLSMSSSTEKCSPTGCEKGGTFYLWADVFSGTDATTYGYQGNCPSGWRLASNDDLIKLVDATETDENDAARPLRSGSGWYEPCPADTSRSCPLESGDAYGGFFYPNGSRWLSLLVAAGPEPGGMPGGGGIQRGFSTPDPRTEHWGVRCLRK